jgi:hypothetical protein
MSDVGVYVKEKDTYLQDTSVPDVGNSRINATLT